MEFEFEEMPPTIKELLDNFELSPYNQNNLDKVPLERQMMLRTQAKGTIIDIESGDEDLKELAEKSLYDLFLTCETGRYALMFQSFISLVYYSSSIHALWAVWQKHLADIKEANGYETVAYIMSVLKAYEVTLDENVVMLSDALDYFREECPDDSILNQLRDVATIFVEFKTNVLPVVDEVIAELEKDK